MSHSVNPSAIPAHSRTPLRAAPPSHLTLSPAERRVIDALLAGYSLSEIGRNTGRDRKTIATQKGAAFEKLGIRKRHELVTYALKAGLMTLERLGE